MFPDGINNWFENKKDYGVIFIRLLIGVYLIYVQHDNFFNSQNMIDVGNFFASHKIPLPFFSAYLSVYAQFFAGILFILGACTRYAAAVMVFNFIIAFIAVDIHKVYPHNFNAQVMLFSSLFLLFNGAGKLSLDKWIQNRKNKAGIFN